MEVGKLVTSESCGNIFYFVIDETHPDEPQPDASKCYYVVAPASSTFSYREAYCVLCRALCGVDNRTYLHRWHSLHEQIFGTTPYVQFVNAVRESAVMQTNSFGAIGSSATPTRHGESDGRPHTQSTVSLPALFLDETTARLALRKAEKEHLAKKNAEAQGVASQPADPQQLNMSPSAQRQTMPLGCSTPVSKPVATSTTRVNAAGVSKANHLFSQPRLQDVKGRGASEEAATEQANPKDAAKDRQAQKLDTLLSMATRWQSAEATQLHQDDKGALAQLRQELRQERLKRLEAEEKYLEQTHALETARKMTQQKQQLVAEAQRANQEQQREEQTRGASEAVYKQPIAAKEKEVAQLTQRAQELEKEMSNAEKRHAAEVQRLTAERDALKQQLWQQSQAQGAQIKVFLEENAGAVKRVEQALEKREKELCAVYTQALEERDVRIAQLSQEVLQHLHNARQLTTIQADQGRFREERVTHLEDMTAQLKEWNATLRQQLSEAKGELRDVRQQLLTAQAHLHGKSSEPSVTPSAQISSLPQCGVCGGLPRDSALQLASRLRDTQEQLARARGDAEAKSQELNRAAQVIEQLLRGVQKAKLDVDAFQGQQVVNHACRTQNVSPLQNIV